MAVGVDLSNSVSVLNSATSLLSNRQKLQNEKDKNLKSNKSRQTKKFIDSFLEAGAVTGNEVDYEEQLQGLTLAEKKKAVEDIMANLQDRVYSCGANLSEAVNPQTIEDYKRAVKTFVNFVAKHSLDMSEIISGHKYNVTKQKRYLLLKVIDEKMERLTKELLFNQLEKLEILDRLGEIKGLLIDLTT